MSRKFLSVLAAAAMIFAVLPATAAFASASSTARLTSQPVVFPGDTTYTVEVKNTEAQFIGKNINAVTITLPTATANVVFRGTPPAAGNFTNVKVTKFSNTQLVTFKGGTIAPQGVQTFSLPVTVQRPARSDLTGKFVVQTSSDNMTSNATSGVTAGGTLTTAVEVLEILTGSIKPVAPTNADNSKGVTDRTGTGGVGTANGQTVTYTFDVKNYAREAISVTGSLAANNTLDKPGAVAAKSIGGLDGTTTFSIPVVLGPAAVQRQTVLTASAVAANADAAQKTDTFTVQVPVNLTFTQLQPLRVTSGPGSAREFTVTAGKTGGPGFSLDSGSLRFGGNVAGLKNAPVTFAAGGQSRSLSYTIAQITGNDGALAASIVSNGGDDNLAPVNLNFAYPDPIVIDNIAPVIDIDLPVLGNAGKDADGDTLVAASDRTAIAVEGCVTGEDLDASTLKVWLEPDAGATIPVTVTQTANSTGRCFTGSVPAATNDTRWDAAATQFKVGASMQDTATNMGTGVSPLTPIDQVAPAFEGTGIVDPTGQRIRLRFADATGIRGACDLNTFQVTVAGQLRQVSAIETGAGVVCSGESESAETARRTLDLTGVRRLVLASPLGPDDLANITYEAPVNAGTYRTAGGYPLKDGAANDAGRLVTTALSTVRPAIPSLTTLQRRDHQTGARETLYLDTQEGQYYTNTGDGEAAADTDDAVKATVGGVKSGYVIEITDGNSVIRTYNARTATPVEQLRNAEWTQDIFIPVPDVAGTYTRGVQLRSSAGNVSLPVTLSIVVDKTLPTVRTATLSGAGEAHVRFAEKIVAGTDNSDDWYVVWQVVTEGELRPAHTQVNTIAPVAEESMVLRRATFTGVDESTFQGLDYVQRNDSSARYEDRAGNYMLDTAQLIE